MGKIVVSQNVSLDGVVEDPSGEEGFRHGGWFEQFIGEDWGRGPTSSWPRHKVPRPCCWVAGATSTLPRARHPRAASGSTS